MNPFEREPIKNEPEREPTDRARARLEAVAARISQFRSIAVAKTAAKSKGTSVR
jgi:hypothetical protein